MARQRRARRSGWFWVFVIVVLVILLGLFFGGYRKGTPVGLEFRASTPVATSIG
ncbi:MAG TPA: hypothetical protein VFX16_18410 [Pseudonocardiaceae bacterium]|nr:hypothetical protein [Pseudonocardiaceae bacterium]